MANPLRGEVEFEIGGEVHTLRLTNGDLMALNERFGKGTWELLLEDIGENLDMRVIVACLHRALYHGAPSSKQLPSEEELAELDWFALKAADAISACIWRSLLGKDPEQFLSENPELAKQAARMVGQRGDPIRTGPEDGDESGNRDSSSPPS